ncbi:MAG: hypothetical protein V4635_02630 [Bacteroidota bacterium]
MPRNHLYLFLLIAVPVIAFSQVRVIKPIKTHPTTTNLGIGVGAANSVVFLARNTTERNNALGITTSLVYGSSKLLRVSLEYTHYGSINIAPTWYNVKANTIEANLHVMYRSKGNLYFFPLCGISYNVFKGYFTGKDDYLNLTSLYPRNQIVTTRWLGFNAGVGLEYAIKKFVMCGGFKMRVGVSEGKNGINILDVCYTAGVRYNLVVPSLYNLFRGTKNRYFIDRHGNL